MTVNFEVKGNVARLLATENLIVEHKQVDTASFNVDARVLTLPMWEKASNSVYDLLVAHEVGHAIFTPKRDWFKEERYKDLSMDMVNVIEDARIEKLMKQKYAGLNRDFFMGYRELNSEDFFELKNIDTDKLKILDRINLYFKVGTFIDLEFNDTESDLVTRISKANTFDEVLDLALELQNYAKDEKIDFEITKFDVTEGFMGLDSEDGESKKTSENNNNLKDGETENKDSDNSEDDSKNESSLKASGNEGESEESENNNNVKDGKPVGGERGGDFDVSDTQRAFDRNVSTEVNNKEAMPTTVINMPELKLDRVIVPFNNIHKYLCDFYDSSDSVLDERDRQVYSVIKNRYARFKKSSIKQVNYMVKEFEMKKSADAYSRATVSKTGVLDTSKLFSYKFNEDIFKKITTIPDGKNHGLVFVLDWSGSMANILEDTFKQLATLLWFCKKANIPFDVYAFSSDSWSLPREGEKLIGNERDTMYISNHQNEGRCLSERLTKGKFKEYDLTIEGNFRMVNILTSKSKTIDFEKAMENMFTVCTSYSSRNELYITRPYRFCLSGTPLNEALVTSRDIIKKFIKEYNLQKCHMIVLTDGESNYPSFDVYGKDYMSDDKREMKNGVPYHSMIRNKNTGKTYKSDNHYSGFTSSVVQAIKDEIDGLNIIGIRILDGHGSYNFYATYGDGIDYEKYKKDMRKNGVAVFKGKQWSTFIGIPQRRLNSIDDLNELLEGKDDVNKADISRSFKKMFNGKKCNKVVAQALMDQIA